MPLFGLAHGSTIQVSQSSAGYDRVTGSVGTVPNSFFFKARDADSLRALRYGKPHTGFDGRRQYDIPITLANMGGVIVGTGTASFTGDGTVNQAGVTTRTISIRDIRLSDSFFGTFSTDDAGSRGDFFEIHAYAGGFAATWFPASASYAGTFLGTVLSADFGTTGASVDLQLPENLTVDFTGGSFTGIIGPTASPDTTLSGTVAGTALTGTATVTSGNVVLTSGSTGAVDAAAYGASGANIAGTFGITDRTGAIDHNLVGAFGTTRQ